MHNTQSEPISEFFAIWIFYVLSFGLITHVIVYILGCVLMVLASTFGIKTFTLKGNAASFAGFMVILLVVSGFINALWNCFVWGKIYIDYGSDTEDDFTPFIPINQIQINEEHGRFLVGTIFQLQMVWLLFALIAWGISFAIYKGIKTIKMFQPS